MTRDDVADADKHTDKVILELLLERREPWSVHDLGRELGEDPRRGSVARLSAAGS
jgi:hypothetical protein